MIFSNILNYLFKMKQPNYYRVQTVTNIKSYKGATGTSVIVSAIKMSYFVFFCPAPLQKWGCMVNCEHISVQNGYMPSVHGPHVGRVSTEACLDSVFSVLCEKNTSYVLL